MSEETTPENTKTVQFTARVKESDKTAVNSFLSKYPVKHEGFSEIVKRLDNEPNNNEDFFILKHDFENLKIENETLTAQIAELRQGQANAANSYLITFTQPLNEKLTNLRRLLKLQKKRPSEETELEFIAQFTELALQKLITDKYDFLNRS